MTKAIVACAALVLAACTPAAENHSATVPANDAAMDATGNEAESGNALATVLAMPDRQRNIVFVRALIDAKLTCDGVIHSERLPDSDGKPVWRADCKNGSSHMISITPDGTANIMSRNDR